MHAAVLAPLLEVPCVTTVVDLARARREFRTLAVVFL
jgi:hypothetical protein